MIKESFRKYLEDAIGCENALVAFSAFDEPASVAVRYNPFKKTARMAGESVLWSRHGILLNERPVFTLDPCFHAGAYYVQDSSSMFVGDIFRRLLKEYELPAGRPLRVLDLCAAPGGKTTDLAASLREACGDGFVLVANEVMKQRAGILASNVALWGDPNVVVTSDDPKAFTPFTGYFDIILADVPCSGEGMFRKDEQACEQWSEDNVALCEGRQRRIIADVWPALADGGLLVYSTCTFNKYENDGNVRWIADNLGGSPVFNAPASPFGGVIATEYGFSLVPGFVKGEGQYCSAVRKQGGNIAVSEFRQYKTRPSKDKGTPIPASLKELFSIDVNFRQRGETIIALPASLAQEIAFLESGLNVIAAGCAAGTVKGKDFIPDADLALSIVLADGAYPEAEVDLDTALAYLHRDAIRLDDAPRGYVMVTYKELPLGFVKNLGNRCNNLYPQSRRIRMNVK
jgi:16S rRNA C967 or C1407 C5-methylase (RsmB/RsmF family)/NOL1/NOP2/fmu family ribosome biogenesis protein